MTTQTATITIGNPQPITATIIAPPLTLYLHLPWCIRKCPYCDFNSHRAMKTLPEDDYVDALLADAERSVAQVWGRRIVAVFIGGGTPNLFSPSAMDRLLCGMRALFNIAPDAEITMEANPGAACESQFAEYRALGISRLSLGVQSFNNTFLNSIGRVHDGKQAQQAARAAARIFDNFNMDLMHALPGQNINDALNDINIAAQFNPAHLSLYQLTLEVGTSFYRRPPPNLPDDDETAQIGDAVANYAMAQGFLRYEISAFSRPMMECIHNLNYWKYGDYLGIGAGAHQKLTIGGKIIRLSKIKNPVDYMRRAMEAKGGGGGNVGGIIAEQKNIVGREAVFEFLLNAFRLTDGFAVGELSARTGMMTSVIEAKLQQAEDDGLIVRTITTIKPTALGLQFLNDLTMRFLPS